MRPLGTIQQLERRRQRARHLLRHGQSPQHVARRVGVTDRSVRRWRQEAQPPRRKSHGRAPGRPCRLSVPQQGQLIRALKRGACHYGYAQGYWTVERIAHLIGELFGVRYRPSSVWYLLHRLEWSCQQPQRRALHRNDDAIAYWKHYVWPHIKKVAAAARNPGFP